MAYTAPTTVVAGQTYSASAHNVIVNDVIDHESRIVTATNQSVQVFTNEAARDAAITSPSEGMHAYLTAPTIPTNTDGCVTMYNGSAWITLTPQSAMVATSQSTTVGQNTYVDLATVGPAVTLVTGTKALVTLSALMTKFMDAYFTAMSFAVSGATTIAAADSNAIIDNTTRSSGTEIHGHTMSRTFMLTGLTAGTNTFTCKYKDNSAFTTGTWADRSITVVGIP